MPSRATVRRNVSRVSSGGSRCCLEPRAVLGMQAVRRTDQ